MLATNGRGTAVLARLLPAFAPASLLLLALMGCGSGSSGGGTITTPPPPISFAFQGHVQAGRLSVSNAQISLYAAGLSGPGAGATDLLAGTPVVTDQTGLFSVPATFSCPSSSTEVYLVARGGNPGLAAGRTNSSLVLATALGDCGSLASSATPLLNEVTTVAAAWALSQFMSPGAVVGASSTNAAGLRNAFAIAAELADPHAGTAPGLTLASGAVPETAKLNALANALAICAASDGASACTALFAASANGGVRPVNTLDAALSIVRNPGFNVAAVFAAGAAQATFKPTLAAAPTDWSLSLTFTGGGLNQPGSLALDSNGNAWIANYFGAVLSEFLPNGTPAAAAGFPGAGLHQSFGVAIDTANNVWVSNETSVTGASNSHLGSISKFSSAGAELSGFGYTGGGIYYPQGIAADTNGNLWVANYGDSSATLLSSTGAPLSPSSGYGYSQLPFTSAVALDATHNAWFAVQGAAVKITAAGALTPVSCCVGPAGIAVDRTGNVWVADYGGASIVELNPAGAVVTIVPSAGGLNAPQGIAIDSAGHVWASNFRGNSITALSGSTAISLSPVAGFGQDAALNEPLGLAIDSSGNLWVANTGNNTVTQFVGLAAPVRTPLAGPPVTP